MISIEISMCGGEQLPLRNSANAERERCRFRQWVLARLQLLDMVGFEEITM